MSIFSCVKLASWDSEFKAAKIQEKMQKCHNRCKNRREKYNLLEHFASLNSKISASKIDLSRHTSKKGLKYLQNPKFR